MSSARSSVEGARGEPVIVIVFFVESCDGVKINWMNKWKSRSLEMLEQWKALGEVPHPDREKFLYVLDGLIRDAKNSTGL